MLGFGGPGIRHFAVAAVNYEGLESDMTPVLGEPVLPPPICVQPPPGIPQGPAAGPQQPVTSP